MGSERNSVQGIASDRRLGKDLSKLPAQDLEHLSLVLVGFPSPEHRLKRDSNRLLQNIASSGIHLTSHLSLLPLAGVPMRAPVLCRYCSREEAQKQQPKVCSWNVSIRLRSVHTT
jgi:hypothetical protein